MVSVGDALLSIYFQLYIRMYPVGDVGDLSLGPGDGSPVAAVPPPPRMSAGYLFSRIRTDKGLLINILALVTAVLIGLQVLLGSQRRRFGSKAFVLPLWVFYTISYPVVSYTIGLVQSVQAPDMPDSQLLWAVGLLLLLGSVDGMSAFSRRDVEQSKGTQAQHVFQTLLVLWLLFSRSVVSDGRWVLLAYFLLCWVYSIFRVAQRMMALRMASSAHGLVRSAKVVADYMESTVKSKAHHIPKDMTECQYLVLGEEEHSSPPSKPPYLTEVDSSKVITIDMIWNHRGKLLSSGDRGSALKDTCLSFALFKLLKRRFCGLDIAEAGDPKTMDFVLDVLLADDERAFRVVEVELSFLYDFFYTKYSALFPTNRVLSVIRFFVLLGFFKVLLLDFTLDGILSYDDAPENTFIYFNNVLLVVMILSIDILQHLATGYSNWAAVHFVCDYVKTTRDGKKRWWKWGRGIRRALITRVVAWRTGKPTRCWDNKLGQYSLLKSYDYNPRKTNAFSWLSLRLMEKTSQGRRREPDAPLTAEVKKAVLGSFKETRGLPCAGRSLKRSGINLQLHWACDLPTHTHTVLVWHIATTMCDLEHTDTDDHESEELRHRIVATTLSGYCAYLLAFVPDMLPDNSYTARQVLDAVVKEARDNLGDTKDMSKRCKMMFELKAEARSSKVEDTPILNLGADLGNQLLCVDKPRRWELLAGFWAELVLFLAPSDNADVHAEHLATGGEFITHLWALLTHAGILERRFAV